MLDAHQAVPTGALSLAESDALSQNPDGKGRGRGPPVWMQICRQKHYLYIRIVHLRVLLCIIRAQRKRPDHRKSHSRALEINGREEIETSVCSSK